LSELAVTMQQALAALDADTRALTALARQAIERQH
jgi:hypothetical protein